MNNADRYVATQDRVVELVAGLDDHERVAATPEWSLHDLLAHVVGVADDVASGRVDGYASADWTHRQVGRGAGRSREELMSDWADSTARLVPVLCDPVGRGLDASFGVRPLLDLLAHEQDIRESNGLAATLDPADWEVVANRRRDVLHHDVTAAQLPALQIRTPEGDSWCVGSGDPSATVLVARQDLWRSLEGRRPREVVRSFDWSADPAPYLQVWLGPVFAWPEDHEP
ncbi:MAG: maleylpyruvate isomerase family mycothiol-dependent enzyme [Ilumatobacteraceae bacterium]